jgi:hypothetical protein
MYTGQCVCVCVITASHDHQLTSDLSAHATHITRTVLTGVSFNCVVCVHVCVCMCVILYASLCVLQIPIQLKKSNVTPSTRCSARHKILFCEEMKVF